MACLFFQATVLSAVALYRSKTLSSQLTISDISHMRVHTNADGEKDCKQIANWTEREGNHPRKLETLEGPLMITVLFIL